MTVDVVIASIGHRVVMDYGSRVLLLVALLCGAASLTVLAAPLLAPHGAFVHLDGTPGILDGGWEGHRLLSLLYGIGDITCHQQYDRSFVLNGSQMPICMRDCGILLGLTLGSIIATVLGPRLAVPACPIVAALLILFIVVEWVVETTGVDLPLIRTLSGVSAGVGGTLLLGWYMYRVNRGMG